MMAALHFELGEPPTQPLAAASLADAIQVAAQFGQQEAIETITEGEHGLDGLHKGADQPFVQPPVPFQQQRPSEGHQAQAQSLGDGLWVIRQHLFWLTYYELLF